MVAPGQTPDTKWIDSSIFIDAITGLGNLFALLQALRQGLQDTAQQPGTLLALVILNIVHNPQHIDQSVNDAISQSKLQTIASRLQEALQDMAGLPLQPTLYRFSNNEFALLVKHDDCRQLRQLICHLQDRVANIVWTKDQPSLTLIASAACFPSCASNMGQMLAYANLFMHKSKDEGITRLTCPGDPEYQDARLLSIELHNYATSLIESLSEKVLATAVQLGEAKHLAFTDPITQLPNQRAARAKLEAMLAAAQLHKTPLSLMLVDGDKLYNYNEMFGYAAGNEMIAWLGKHLREFTAPSNFVARWLSGDEFLVLCPNLKKEDCLRHAEAMRQHVQSNSRELLLPITVSIGVAAYPEDGITKEQLLGAIEMANKQAKHSGRNQVCSYRKDLPFL